MIRVIGLIIIGLIFVYLLYRDFYGIDIKTPNKKLDNKVKKMIFKFIDDVKYDDVIGITNLTYIYNLTKDIKLKYNKDLLIILNNEDNKILLRIKKYIIDINLFKFFELKTILNDYKNSR